MTAYFSHPKTKTQNTNKQNKTQTWLELEHGGHFYTYLIVSSSTSGFHVTTSSTMQSAIIDRKSVDCPNRSYMTEMKMKMKINKNTIKG